jgi:hypothetical protein
VTHLFRAGRGLVATCDVSGSLPDRIASSIQTVMTRLADVSFAMQKPRNRLARLRSTTSCKVARCFSAFCLSISKHSGHGTMFSQLSALDIRIHQAYS